MRTVARRILQLIVVLIVVTFFTSILTSLLPGDPVTTIAPFSSAQDRANIREQLHLNENIVERYGQWLKNFVSGDMGREYVGTGIRGTDIYGRIKDTVPRSLLLMLYVQILTLLIAVPLGVYSAYRAGGRFDDIANGFAFFLLSIPIYVAATLMLLFLSVQHHILPSEGWVAFTTSPVDHFKHLVMPVLAITLGQIAIYARLLRTDMVATLQEDFILMAKSKGISERRVLWRHALRPSSLTLLTVAGLNVGTLIGGALIVEVIFHLNGLGFAIYDAISRRQYIALQDYIAVIAIVYVLVNFAVDGLYHVLDQGSVVLESAEPQVDAEKIAATVAVEDIGDEVFEKRGIGVLAWIGIGWLVFIIGIALLAPLLPLKDPTLGDYLHTNASAFSPGHLLGSDATGRDVLSRVIWGARASLLLAIGSVLFGTLIGGFLGLLAGFRGRATDTVLSSFTNILLAFPQLVLALTLVSVFAPLRTASNGNAPPAHEWGHRILVVILAVGIVSIPILARITRASALSWTQREFVMAARAQGAADKRVMFREVLPNVMPAMLSIALLGVAVVLILEGALAVFGVSIQEPNPSWGNMIYSQLSDLSASPAVWLVPSILIFLTVLALNYLGDVVRSRFDVRESVL